MSGIIVLCGPGATERQVRTMAAAAPWRGARLTVANAADAWLVAQNLDFDTATTSAAVWAGDGLAIAMAGCLFEDSKALPAASSIEELASTFRSGGISGISSLVGAFAAVIYDLRTSTMFATRSGTTERPLLSRTEVPLRLFASDIAHVLAGPMPAPKPSVELVMDALATPAGHPDRTLYPGIFSIAGGMTATVERDGEPSMKRHLTLPDWDDSMSEGDAVEEFRRLLKQAVARRLTDPAALLLSGGIDSTSIAAAAATPGAGVTDDSLVAVSARYPQFPSADESSFVETTAKKLRMKIEWVEPRPRPFDEIDHFVGVHNGPDPMPMASNMRTLYAAARESGRRLIVDGHDGDGLFGIAAGVGPALLRRRRIGTLWRHAGFIARREQKSMPAAAAGLFARSVLSEDSFVRLRIRERRGPNPSMPGWIVEPLRSLIVEGTKYSSWYQERSAALSFRLTTFLQFLERLALSESVIVTHPLADQDLVQFAATLPPEILFADGRTKSLARAAYPSLPHVMNRIDKTRFGEAFSEGSPADAVSKAVDHAPHVLPGIDWARIDRLARDETSLSALEKTWLLTVLSADYFLGRG